MSLLHPRNNSAKLATVLWLAMMTSQVVTSTHADVGTSDPDPASALVRELQDELAAMKAETATTLRDMQQEISDLKKTKSDERRTSTRRQPSTHSQAGFACDTDIVTLLCTENRTIDISSAHYGIYADACDVSCCAAAAGDCTESLEETAPVDWTALLLACQNRSFCQFEHPGRSLSSCAEPIDSDYVIVSYTCQPEDEAVVTFDPVGFTAASDGASFQPGDIIQFSNVLYDRGQAYDASTGVFTCPVRGMYMFSAALLSSNVRDAVASIHHGDDIMASLFGYDNTFNHGSTSCVFECDVGDEVWLEAAIHDDQAIVNDSITQYNTFSGHLIAPISD